MRLSEDIDSAVEDELEGGPGMQVASVRTERRPGQALSAYALHPFEILHL